ncbi:YshB family small membrane protein [Erwinia tracheiphila]|nr:YshB family small membrane protein [Erwinia tracheiphila]UIA83135.1 YshB family small membrane protein [Erwinia tracheiphila]UIA88210.1 YshB family small membrane protein [Erwinia tracheiphila]UIA91714.1 YshB family small membrane protein [Erwinia tracheiphila]UIA96369.1 YshB family small membrane protein [Erwinia tracheiphila]
MLESIIHFVTQTAETGAHTPQTAMAAIMCALMLNLFH